MINKQLSGDFFSATATHATAAVATKDAATGKTHYVTDVTVSSDKAGSICLIKTGTTVKYQFQVGAGVHSIQFDVPIVGDVSALVSAEIDGTSACKANMTGFTI